MTDIKKSQLKSHFLDSLVTLGYIVPITLLLPSVMIVAVGNKIHLLRGDFTLLK